jgi:arginyl-tRNA synthetase
MDTQPWSANQSEMRLIKKIANFPQVLHDSIQKLIPSMLANYAYDLCQSFNHFFHECPVLKSQFSGQRLALVAAFRNTIGIVLDLLGIQTLEEM